LEHEFPRLGRKRIALNIRRLEAENPETTVTIISISDAS
jgi:hypothetical protein